MPHPVDRALEDRDLSAETERDDSGVVADDAAPDDDDATLGDAGHAPEENPATALWLLQVMRARLRREPAGDLAHRREQRKRAACRLDGLVGDGGDPGLDERARERLVRGDVQVGEQREAFAEVRVLLRDRLLHLQEEIRATPDVVDRHERGPGALVRRVGKRATGARARLHEHLVPALGELSCACRGQSDPGLLRLDLLRNAYPHRARDDTSSAAGQTLDVASLLCAEPRGRSRSRVLVCTLGLRRRGDHDVDPIVGERPLEKCLPPRGHAERRERLQARRTGISTQQGAPCASERTHDDHGDTPLVRKRKDSALRFALERVQRNLHGVEAPGLQRPLELRERSVVVVSDAESVDLSRLTLLLEPVQMVAPGDEVVDLFDLDASEEPLLCVILRTALVDV